MALGNTPRKETNFAVEASKSFAFRMSFKDRKGPLDLTGCAIRLVAASGSARGQVEVLNKTIEGGPSGIVTFKLQAADLALPPGSYPYDVTLIPNSGYSTPIVKGYIEVGSNTDLEDSNVYTDVSTGTGVTAILEEGDVVQITIDAVDGMYGDVLDAIHSFTREMESALVTLAEGVKSAANSAEHAASYVSGLMAYLASIGFPYWVGTLAEYKALTEPSPLVMYLIKD